MAAGKYSLRKVEFTYEFSGVMNPAPTNVPVQSLGPLIMSGAAFARAAVSKSLSCVDDEWVSRLR